MEKSGRHALKGSECCMLLPLANDDLLDLPAWAHQAGLSVQQAMTLAATKQLPGARKCGEQWLVPSSASRLPIHSAATSLTPGQQRVRDVVAAFLPRYHALPTPFTLFCASEAVYRDLSTDLQCTLEHDPVIASDDRTGVDLNRPAWSRTYLDAHSRDHTATSEDVRDTTLPVALTAMTDIRDRAHSRLLGAKPSSTVSALCALVAGERVGGWQVDITLFTAQGVAYISSGGAHRTLATLLAGGSALNVDSVRLVHAPLDPVLNAAVRRVERLLADRRLHLPPQYEAEILALNDILDVAPDDERAHLLQDLVRAYLTRPYQQDPAQPAEVLQAFRELSPYVARLLPLSGWGWDALRATVRDRVPPTLRDILLPQTTHPAQAWCRRKIVDEWHHPRAST